MGEYESRVNMIHTHTNTHINTMTWPGLGAGTSENQVTQPKLTFMIKTYMEHMSYEMF